MELYIPPKIDRNAITGRFIKGVSPWNKGKKMNYKNESSRNLSVINLKKGQGGNHRNGAGHNKRPVVAIKDGKFYVFPSATEASIKVGCGQTSITAACKKRIKTCLGFKWYYEDDSTWLKQIE